MANLIRFFCADCMQGGFGTSGKEYKCKLCSSVMYQHGMSYPANSIKQFPNLNERVDVYDGDDFEEHF